jgi:hypothetical protein
VEDNRPLGSKALEDSMASVVAWACSMVHTDRAGIALTVEVHNREVDNICQGSTWAACCSMATLWAWELERSKPFSVRFIL